MKISFLLLLFIISCQEKKVTCEEQREKAKKDFKNNSFTYFEHISRSNSLDTHLEFEKLLNENNIKVVFDTISPMGCIADSGKDPNNEFCYQEMMNNNLYAKYGNKFFDSLKLKAQYIHLQKFQHK